MAVQVEDWLDSLEKVLEGRDPDGIRGIELQVIRSSNRSWWMEAEITYEDDTKVKLI